MDFDTTWDAETIHVLDDVKIAPTATLTIIPGARLIFEGYYSLIVTGALQATGTAANPITFTSSDPHAFQPDSTLAGAWNGIRFERVSASNPESRLEHCVIEYAKSERDSILVGALVCDDFSNLKVVNSIIRRNVAHYGGALFCIKGSAPTLIGCVLVENTALRGGSAVYCLDSYPHLIQCTIAANHDSNPIEYRPSAAIMSYMSKPRIEGCVLWDNTSLHLGSGQTWGTKSYYTEWSDIQGGHDGLGNIDQNPLFLNEGVHVFSTTENSPCVNAGPTFPPDRDLPLVDPAGQPRITDAHIDMGAYEGAFLTEVNDRTPLLLVELDARPNPFNPTTELSFILERGDRVDLRIFDVRGTLVQVLKRGTMPAGHHVVAWDGTDAEQRALPSGTYIAELKTTQGRSSRLLALIK